MKTGIYKITSPSGRVYIGKANDINRRWSEYRTLHKSIQGQIKLYRSFLKYKVENHIFEILEKCNKESLNERERHYQDFYNVLNGGLNCVLQETNVLPRIESNEVIEKRRLRMIGTNNPNYKKIFSQKEKENLRYRLSGELNENSKLIVDLQTGIFYFGTKEASSALNIKRSTLVHYLLGTRKNKTSLIYT